MDQIDIEKANNLYEEKLEAFRKEQRCREEALRSDINAELHKGSLEQRDALRDIIASQLQDLKAELKEGANTSQCSLSAANKEASQNNTPHPSEKLPPATTKNKKPSRGRKRKHSELSSDSESQNSSDSSDDDSVHFKSTLSTAERKDYYDMVDNQTKGDVVPQ